MKKILLIGAATLMVSNPTFAGGILTNTNQHASFLRMIARGASIDIDGVYSNPAGLSFLPEDGFYLSLTGQSAYQTREITSTFPLFQAVDGEGTFTKVRLLLLSSPVSTELTRKAIGLSLPVLPSPAVAARLLLMTVCPCSVLLQWGCLQPKD